MQLSQNQKIFSQTFFPFPESTKDLEFFFKKELPQGLFLSEIINCKRRGYLTAYKAPCQNTY